MDEQAVCLPAQVNPGMMPASIPSVLAAVALMTSGGGHAVPRHSASLNTSSTELYIRAGYTEARRETSQLQVARHSVAHLIGEAERDCPQILASVPPSDTRGRRAFVAESSGAILAAVVAPFAPAEREYAHTIRSLHWTSHVVGRLIAEEATTELAIASLPEPQLCQDARLWVTRSYAAVPKATTGFNREASRLLDLPEPAKRIRHLITAFEGSDDGLNDLHRTSALQSKVDLVVKRIFERGTLLLTRVVGLTP